MPCIPGHWRLPLVLPVLFLAACVFDDSSSSTATLSGTIDGRGSPSSPSIPGSAGGPGALLGIGTPTASTTTDSATLSWSAPTTNADGSPVTNLAGYTINYGTTSSGLDQVVQINDPSTTTYTISSLAAGTWYFALNAVNTEGGQSALSEVASKTVL